MLAPGPSGAKLNPVRATPTYRIWSAVRGPSGVTGRPARVRPRRAAETLAGNIATISSASAAAAGRAVVGINNAAAPANSSTPVAVTRVPGWGRRGGTMAIRPSRRGEVKWAKPVSTNSSASPTRSAGCQPSSAATPASPARRATAVPTSRAINGTMRASSGANLYADKIAIRMTVLSTSRYAGGMTDTRGYHHGDLPRALLAAAAEAIAEFGPAALSLRDLARRAGVSHAAPTHHFGDKAGLLTALAVEGFDLLAAAPTAAGDDLLDVGVAYVDFAVRPPGPLRGDVPPRPLPGRRPPGAGRPASARARHCTSAWRRCRCPGRPGRGADGRAGRLVDRARLRHPLALRRAAARREADPRAAARTVIRRLFTPPPP